MAFVFKVMVAVALLPYGLIFVLNPYGLIFGVFYPESFSEEQKSEHQEQINKDVDISKQKIL